MKTQVIIIFFFLISGPLFSQDKNERTQPEMEKSGVSELDAKKAVLSFFYDTKSQIRDSSRDLSLLEWESISRIQEGIWNYSIRGLLQHYSATPHGYNRFLADHYETLLMYKDVIMDIFHSALYKDLSEEELSQMSGSATDRVQDVGHRDF